MIDLVASVFRVTVKDAEDNDIVCHVHCHGDGTLTITKTGTGGATGYVFSKSPPEIMEAIGKMLIVASRAKLSTGDNK